MAIVPLQKLSKIIINNAHKTNKRVPKKIWVPKEKLVHVANMLDMLENKKETSIMIPGHLVLTSHDRFKV